MAKTKKKVLAKLKTRKRTGVLRSKKVLKRVRKAKKDTMNSDIIFDSSTGKTDALFVSDPEENIPPKEAQGMHPLPPALADALREFDELSEIKTETQPEIKIENKEEITDKNATARQEKKKSLWKRLFGR